VLLYRQQPATRPGYSDTSAFSGTAGAPDNHINWQVAPEHRAINKSSKRIRSILPKDSQRQEPYAASKIDITCSALPLEKGRTYMLSATPWITDSTTIQNIVIIAIVSKLQYKSRYISIQPYNTQQTA
jgi:hypothetical protein